MPLRLSVGALSLAGLLLIGGMARAHDHWGHPNWIANGLYTSPIDGSHCCGLNDCVALDSAIVTEIETGFALNGQGLNEFVPRREAQTSQDGNYWRCKKADGSRRCFFTPIPSM